MAHSVYAYYAMCRRLESKYVSKDYAVRLLKEKNTVEMFTSMIKISKQSSTLKTRWAVSLVYM